MNAVKMKKGLFIASVLVMVLAGMFLAGCNDEEEPAIGKLVKVERGDLRVSVAADGRIEMPREVELRFGNTGAVADVLVAEGDVVYEGTLLARLDNTSQKNAIITALYDMQQSRNVLTTGCRGGLDYIYTYPNTSAIRIFEEAQGDLEESLNYLGQGYYKEAASNLRMAQYQLEICVELLETQLAAIETYPITPATATYEERPDIPDREQFFLKTDLTIKMLQQDYESLTEVHGLIARGDYTVAVNELTAVLSQMIASYQAVNSTIGQISRNNVTYPDTVTSTEFLDSCKDSLVELMDRMEEGDYDAVEFAESLLMALLDLEIGHDVLETSSIIYESGLNLKEIEQYNLDLQAAELDLKKGKNELSKTEILAPFDSKVVDVGVEVDSVLSSVDYSARTAVTLLDTRSMEFNGIVGEIDIFKVKVGQKALITVDALPDEEFTGTVTFISPFGTSETGVVNFAVTIELEQNDIDLRGGLTATADILVTDRENVLLIPTQAIIATPVGNIVIVMNDMTGERERRRITLGEQDYQFAEVISGLSEGETVVIIDEATIEAARSQAQSGTEGTRRPPGGGGGRFLR